MTDNPSRTASTDQLKAAIADARSQVKKFGRNVPGVERPMSEDVRKRWADAIIDADDRGFIGCPHLTTRDGGIRDVPRFVRAGMWRFLTCGADECETLMADVANEAGEKVGEHPHQACAYCERRTLPGLSFISRSAVGPFIVTALACPSCVKP